MYNTNTALALTGGGGLIAGVNGLWWVLGAFALIAAGTALSRIAPRRQEK